MADYDGMDAIIVVTTTLKDGGLPVVGHVAVYLQDSDGNWYITEYTGNIYDPRNATVQCDPAKMDDVQKMLDQENIDGKEYVYIKGNFNESVEYAKSVDDTKYGGYDPVFNNCAHYVQNVMRRGSFENELVRAKTTIHKTIPITYLNDIIATVETVKIRNDIADTVKSIWNTAKDLWARLKRGALT
jgi:hypothetical protein